MQILAGDIGGTNTRLTLYNAASPTKLEPLREETYPSAAFDNLDAILQRFLETSPTESVERACFGIAGPVIDQVCSATNLPWRVAASEIEQTFDFDAVWLLNDLEANAWGIEALPEEDLLTLSPGHGEAKGNRSIISAGTGLGEAGLFWDGRGYQPFPSEGGHSDFSPCNLLQFELYQWLADQYGHVSWERLVSGPGLENLHRFITGYRQHKTPDWLLQQMSELGRAPAISNAALQALDPICVEALDLFISLYGREAGIHALKIMATGGVYLGGGIAPKILPRLKNGGFLTAFHNKGRMRPLMETMPVHIILNDKAALLGAARFAALQ
ncbi:MAG: glucokinase [Candidatus Thiodiazotropha sp. (ex Myrtea spinifera)]|nr:glucokinase [Candidatus Thiodiazotropha sp. (ex Myrtea spinifera)]MCU7828540.1 glucokinase [Candidatus Thiodiazotropha sp. (ex Myrtea sp. 'scaly one' KF741663)]